MQSASEPAVYVEDLIRRTKELQQSILALLAKLELHDKLEWTVMLENFGVLSGEYNNLMQILHSCRMPLKNFVLMPCRLSMEADSRLENLTERRIRAWSHAIVPDHLRTKVDDRVLVESRPVVDNPTVRTPTSAENLQKLINQLNKACQNASELLLNASKDEIDVEGPRIEETSKPEDTRQLVGAVSMGLGLRPTPMPTGPTPMNPQMTQVPGGKYASTVKSALKSTAANMAQPYGPR